jgi:carnitine 3-dehydrogenase
VRDDNLVAILQALRTRDYAGGSLLKQHEAQLVEGRMLARAGPSDPSKPSVLYSDVVQPDWIDYNGHMNESRYLEAFGNATTPCFYRLAPTPPTVDRI